MPGLLCFSDVCLEAKSSLKDLACTLTTHCQCWIHVPYLPGPAVARQVIVPCCHVIFAQVVALNWWGIYGYVWMAFKGTDSPSQQSDFTPHLPGELRSKCLGSCFQSNQPDFWLFSNTVIGIKLESLKEIWC